MDIETLVARGLQVLLALGGAYLIALWFVIVVWTFRDIETRSRSVVTQVFSTLLVVLFYLPGLVLYRLLRPRDTLDEAYQHSLEEEYLLQDLEELPLCPSCNHYVEDDFQICPHCSTQLREPCSHCERLIDLRWDVCPYCGTTHQGQHEHEAPDMSVSDDRWVDPVAIERRLREEEERRERGATRALPAATAATVLGQPGADSLSNLDQFRDRHQEGEAESVAPTRREPAADRPEGSVSSGEAEETSTNGLRRQPDLSGLEDPAEDQEEQDDRPAKTIPDRYRV